MLITISKFLNAQVKENRSLKMKLMISIDRNRNKFSNCVV